MHEFELIEKYFKPSPRLASTLLGPGDDAALLTLAKTEILLAATDSFVAGTHFFIDTAPKLLGHKALAVNLSDLAAMGAKPLAFLLALTLPKVDEPWLEQFSQGLTALADQHQIDLVGGDTTRGPLSITITVLGTALKNKVLYRHQAKIGDDIYVTGQLGGAALGLQVLKGEVQLAQTEATAALTAFHCPMPRLAFGQALAGKAHAAIDISDGLAQDLGHILKASQVGAQIFLAQVPCFPQASIELALSGGEDYELCFTAPLHLRAELQALAQQQQLPLHQIGSISAKPGLEFLDAEQKIVNLSLSAYQHF